MPFLASFIICLIASGIGYYYGDKNGYRRRIAEEARTGSSKK